MTDGAAPSATSPPPAAVGSRLTLRRRLTPYLVLAVLLSVTALAAFALHRTIADRDMERFRREVQSTQDRIVGRVETYVTTLLAARATLSVLDPLDTARFRAWLSHLDVPHRHSGVQGMGFALYVPPGARARTIEDVRARGAPGFRIFPGAEVDPACTVVVVEPMVTLNASMVGFDMCSEPIRRAAMEQARDSGMPTASDRVTPVARAADDNLSGFLLYVPVYRQGTPSTVAQRRADLVGFVYARFRASELFLGILGAQQHPLLSFTIDDPDAPSPEQFLYTSDPGLDDPGYRSRLALSLTAPVAGRNWEMVFRSRPSFDALSSRNLVWYLALGGLGISLAVMMLVRAQIRARAAAEESEARLRFVWRATAEVASSLEPAVMAEALARVCLPALGDWCSMDLLDDDGRATRLVLAHADPALADVAAQLRDYPTRGRSAPLVARVLAEKKGARLELNDQMLLAAAQDDHHLGLLRRMSVGAAMVVPLISRGRALGWFGLLRRQPYSDDDLALVDEVSRRVAMALDNARLYSQAQEAVRTRDAFLSIASHELKAPLTALRVQAQGLLRSLERTPALPDVHRLARRAASMDQQTQRLARLIDDLMDVSRLSAGRLAFDLEDVNLAEVVRDVVERFDDEAGAAGSRLQVEIPVDVVGRWDRGRLDQVLTNLLSNAIKYGDNLPVTVRVETRPGLARLCVRDRGIGIATGDQGRIFERFERVAAGQEVAGFGLGLWITRHIVEAQGGRVLVESAPGEGSTFVVELPTGH